MTTFSPLRRSKRCNKQSSSPKSSESTAEISSRSPELNNKKRKVERREKTQKQSIFGTMDATENLNCEYDSGRAKRIRMTRRANKALFPKQEKRVKVSGKYEELASPNKSPAKDGSNSGGCMSKERAAAVESGQVTATKSSPGKETAENLHEKESTQINQINSTGQVVIQDTANVDESVNEKIHSLPLLPVTELREMDISIVAELPEVADSSTKEKGNDVDAYEERVVQGRADATAIAVRKDNSSVASPPSHQENHVGEATTVNLSRKRRLSNKTQILEAEDYRTPSSNTSQSAVFSPANWQVILEDNKNKLLNMMHLLPHEKERNEICSTFEEAKANLDKKHRIVAAVVRSLHGEGPTRTDKLNALESWYNRKVEDHKNQMLPSLSELERAHIDDRTKLQLKEASLIEEQSDWAQTKLLMKPAESAGGGETCFSDSEGPDIIKLNGARASAAPEEATVAARAPEESLSEARAPEEAPSEAGAHEEAPAAAKAPDAVGASKEAPNEARAPEETPAAALAVISASESSSYPVMRFRLSKSNVSLLDHVDTGLLEHHIGANRLDQDREVVSLGPCPSESIPNGATSSLPGDGIPLNEHQNNSALAVKNADQDNLPPQEMDVPYKTSSLPRREGPLDKESITRFPDHVVPIDAHSEDTQIDCHLDGTVATHEETVNLPEGEAATDIGSIDLQEARDNIVGDVPSRLNNFSLCKDRPISEVNVGVSDATSADEQDISGNPNQQEPLSDERGKSTLPQLVDITPRDDSVLSNAVQCTVNTQATHVPTITIASGSGTGSMQPSFCMPSGRSESDPLQSEIDKIRKQMDHSMKNLEETKKQLEVECQKEIAEIRQKFAVKVQESEAQYVSEKNQLETYLQKVRMSKIFVAAFRNKCMDPKKAGTSATTIRPPDIWSNSQPWITSAASVHRFSSFSSMNHTSAAGATSNLQWITQPTAVAQPRAPDATSNSQSQPINPPTAVVPPRAPAPVRPPPLVQALHRSPLHPSSHRPLLSQGQREVVIRSPAPHLQSASRPLSHPRSIPIPPPPGYQPRAVAQTGSSSSVANRMDQVGSRIPQPPNVHDRRFIANLSNAAQARSNGSAIIDAPNIIDLSGEE